MILLNLSIHQSTAMTVLVLCMCCGVAEAAAASCASLCYADLLTLLPLHCLTAVCSMLQAYFWTSVSVRPVCTTVGLMLLKIWRTIFWRVSPGMSMMSALVGPQTAINTTRSSRWLVLNVYDMLLNCSKLDVRQ